MATTTTPNLNLVKPTLGTGEPANISVINGNMDIIDTAVNDINTAVNNINTAKVSKTGDTVTGALTIKAGNMDRDGANPSSDTYFSAYRIVDKDGEIIGLIRPRRYTNGTQYLQFLVFNENSSNAEVNNIVQAWLGKDGSKGFSAEGQIAISNGQFRATSTNITEGSTSTNTEGNGRLYFMSNDGKIICRIHPWQVADDGTQRLRILVQRVVNGTTKYNGLNLGINSAGEAKIVVEGTNAAASWRAAIGANSATNLTAGTLPDARISAADAVTCSRNTTNTTGGGVWVFKRGKMATLIWDALAVKSGSSRVTVATVPSGYRPNWSNYGYNIGRASPYIVIQHDGAVQVDAQSSAITLYGSATYCIA